MNSFSLKQWIVIIILALLTALEPLSIDLYLPGFILMSGAFSVPVSDIQISLSTFLAGFAVGQLFWGPIADKFGRKKPIILSLIIFIIASIACIYVTSVKQLWLARFIQALGGCGGIVISRAVVTDYFDRSRTLRIFTLLALIMSIAPIVGPIIGNGVLKIFSWEGLFGTMAALGVIMLLLTIFFLPETRKNRQAGTKTNFLKNYLQIFKVKQFTIYALIAGVANGALMVYVGNAPYLIMDYGKLSAGVFSIVFAINATGLMISSYITGYLQKYMSTETVVKVAMIFMMIASIALLGVIYWGAGIITILIVLFFYIFPIGMLFPATTELSMKPFTHNSGSASALFGSIQLLIACICTLISDAVNNGSVFSIGIAFFICGIMLVFFIFQKKEKESLNLEYN